METGFRPIAGQVVLLEYTEDRDRHTATGLVIDTGAGSVTINLAPTAPAPEEGSDVVASLFAPEALYRAHAVAHLDDPGCITLDEVHDVERVQRRSWPRRTISLPVSLVPLDDAAPVPVPGRTIDLGVGGARVRAERTLPAGVDPSVALTLPDGASLLVAARVVYADADGAGCDYRLAFCDLDEADAAALASLVGAGLGA